MNFQRAKKMFLLKLTDLMINENNKIHTRQIWWTFLLFKVGTS